MKKDTKAERYQKILTMLHRRQLDLAVLMDNVHKPQNLAAIIRSSDAVGIGKVHAVYPHDRIKQCRHIAGGSSRWVDVETHATIEQALHHFKQQGMQLIAAHPGDRALPYQELDYTKPTCIIAGAELDGLSPAAIEQADHLVSIPMLGMAQSLNVSVATAIILYEVQAQRLAAGSYEKPQLCAAECEQKIMRWLYPRIAAYCEKSGLSYPVLNEDGDLEDSAWDSLRKEQEEQRDQSV